MPRTADFDHSVPLPPGLKVSQARRAIQFVERELSDLVEIYYEQMNVFCGIVGIFGTKALDAVSNYEKPRRTDTRQQRFPDLCRRGSREPRQPCDWLESKGSKRPWAIQSHDDHPGWYIVYAISSTRRKQLSRVNRLSSGELT